MSLKRRQLLVLGGLGSLGLAVAGKTLSRPSEQISGMPQTVSELPKPARKELMLRFAAVADSGAGDRNQLASANAMVQYHRKNPYSLVTLAGDNIYNSGEMERIGVAFEEPYAPLLSQNVRFRACLGNHDIRTENGDPQVQYANFNMNGRYYTYREKDVQFFVLDTNVNADWKDQMAWLDAELGRSTAPWKIVYGHHPIYSSGHYGTDAVMVQKFSPLFKKHQVQLYINGHEHHYERSASIEGTTYLVTGIGGASLRPVGRSKMTEYSVSRYGFSAIEVYPDHLKIEGIGADGLVFDRGVIARQAKIAV
ncbi:metallophosphoesterase family protein [Leptolyngbya sp. NIES-2104]|uniref:metallophosphoesterase family protein n=1 Tax=Leptolyngbya sp. NIES-2104 TaxID=1552121 RepID=UPI0006EC962A|nr:metallophosphoesterase [Leptolyngbya sp. NIES-2104]GAP97401.1 putative purple acid phosphatase precursor [Leptolyngbya sp. NIES-2104]